MNIDLKMKRAVVCGSTQGIGKAIAVSLAEAGAEILLIARNEEKLKAVKNELNVSAGQKHGYIVADFSKHNELEKSIEVLENSKIHILVNNTGGPAPGTIVDANSADFLDALTRHLFCNQILTQTVLPAMKKEKYGRIINIISTSVKEPIPGLGVSNTTRAAVAGWSKTLSLEVASHGITVNNILPGLTRTGRLKSLVEQKALHANKSIEEIENEMLKEIPVGRFAEPEELSALAVFLASPFASYINGVNIQVDGGKMKGF